ncbi:hypothetical protein KXX13_001510 [Aspergillus fumigatus]|nr:hypothetical protein CNMCM8714_008537 [Aspergillus fumigatus]KAF4278380.1 hypothetical protein CNMCM8057_000814 [Aspergillus fumigatus]KAH1307157.1 hypothetical protein KXX11_004211 [Aspergillus fumigatus]KAH1466242.1 hypothetical protein KXX13_001510 [Aspergillus fumigatus]KAH1535055.1 hypothetical protein KXX18_000671 [Aspergillus fumigatus]
MIVSRLFHLILVIWCAFSDGYDLSERKQPQGRLGITLDYGLARNWPPSIDDRGADTQRNWFYSSHLTFKEPVSTITDGQLWQMVRDALDEIPAVLTQYGISKNKGGSNVMTVLAFSNEIILASSKKSVDSFTYEFGDGNTPNNELPIHKNQGHCGEPMAAHLYYASHTTPLAEQNARVATIVYKSRAPPCGTGKTDYWGCNLFVEQMKMRVVDLDIGKTPNESYDLSTLAGGNPKIDQIPVCSTPTVS